VDVQRIECTNCGGDELIAIASLAIALASLIAAVVAAALALRAKKAADDTLAIARDEASRSKVEHAEFKRQQEARARFDVTVRALPPADDGVFTLQASETNVHIEIGISNQRGDKAAGPTTINVLVPKGTSRLRWSGPRGEARPNVTQETLSTPEALVDADGKLSESEYVSRQLGRVTRRTAHLMHVTFPLPLPAEGESSVPIRVRVESDDLPDDQPEVVIDYMVRGRRPQAA
jgi:hypothetical protein